EVAVVPCVRWVNRPDKAMVRTLGEQFALEFRTARVRRDDRERRVSIWLGQLGLERTDLGEAGHVLGRGRAGEHGPVLRVDVAHGVHAHQGADDNVTVARARRTQPAGNCVFPTAPLADRRAAPGADATDLWLARRLA